MPEREPETPVSVRRARLFRYGQHRALRIPRAFGLGTEEVIIYKHDDRLVVEQVRRTPSLAEVLATLEPLEEEFPVIADPPTEPEDILISNRPRRDSPMRTGRRVAAPASNNN